MFKVQQHSGIWCLFSERKEGNNPDSSVMLNPLKMSLSMNSFRRGKTRRFPHSGLSGLSYVQFPHKQREL